MLYNALPTCQVPSNQQGTREQGTGSDREQNGSECYAALFQPDNVLSNQEQGTGEWRIGSRTEMNVTQHSSNLLMLSSLQPEAQRTGSDREHYNKIFNKRTEMNATQRFSNLLMFSPTRSPLLGTRNERTGSKGQGTREQKLMQSSTQQQHSVQNPVIKLGRVYNLNWQNRKAAFYK